MSFRSKAGKSHKKANCLHCVRGVNALRHGRPKHITIKLLAADGSLELRVEDDGSGISSEALRKPTGMGLHIINYRARAIGSILCLAPGSHGGTTLTCCLPAPANHARTVLDVPATELSTVPTH